MYIVLFKWIKEHSKKSEGEREGSQRDRDGSCSVFMPKALSLILDSAQALPRHLCTY